MSGQSGRLTETTPTRTWTNTTGNPVGGSRTAAEQTLSFTEVGTSPNPPDLPDGTYKAITSGKALDNPNHSTSAGTQMITWSPNGGSNQDWTFTQQSDGTYQIVNGRSQLCLDVYGGSTSAGAAIIQWTCHGGSNQRWVVTALDGGGYTITSLKSGLLLTTASTANGALVTQQANSNSSLQHWLIN